MNILSHCIQNTPRFCLMNAHKYLMSTTHFGFETVPTEVKQSKVNHVFENVSKKYDLMNDIMSFGVHRLWKDCFVNRIMPTDKLKYLDVAGGTGDIAFRINKYAKHICTVPEALETKVTVSPDVTVCDINPSMMEVGKLRAKKLGFSNIQWVEGNAENLPFNDNSFDVYTIAFGIRNCTHIEKVITEAYRVLRPWGRFYCLEFSKVENFLFRSIYNSYSMQLIPVIGQLVAGDWDSYKYLVESIRKFPDQKTFAHMIAESRFDGVNWINYSNGIVSVHMGYKVPFK
ncbi:2-methoxy-6-polyprenyl-1,4-benzoquinol methylase, mitochondrial [Schistosoma japonicum]|nr:2-methoxy-6-polyprenyl-1,4-benzoquinol methylase, mitochondrial [Schistosoma japonicum]KAH8862301.1 2-methoxy-6-polyprenyl-1,4-benzoquinol methylase, mitochondrial [Schistosoma japonicum]